MYIILYSKFEVIMKQYSSRVFVAVHDHYFLTNSVAAILFNFKCALLLDLLVSVILKLEESIGAQTNIAQLKQYMYHE